MFRCKPALTYVHSSFFELIYVSCLFKACGTEVINAFNIPIVAKGRQRIEQNGRFSPLVSIVSFITELTETNTRYCSTLIIQYEEMQRFKFIVVNVVLTLH